MLKILFFARLREELDTHSLDIEWSDSVSHLDTLQAKICQEQGGQWSDVLGQENIIRAVNHEVVHGNRALADGDEIAFFPPVTGG